MKGFLLSFRSEFYKSRKTAGFWGAIILPLIISSLAFIGFFLRSEKFFMLPPMQLWVQFSLVSLSPMGALLLPMLTIFVAYSVNNVEHKADTWKTLFSLPISRWAVYSAKYFYALFLIFICLTLFVLLTIGFGNFLGLLKPELRFNEYHLELQLAQVYFKLFLSALGILSIQFLLSLLWSDFLKPIGLGFIATIIGGILGDVSWKFAYLFPYSHPIGALKTMVKISPKGKANELLIDIFTKDVYVSVVISAVVFVVGYVIVQRRSVK